MRAILTDALARAVDPSDDRDLSWFWVVVRPRLGEYGVAAFDADDALTVLACVRYPGREAPTARSITDLGRRAGSDTRRGSTPSASPPSAACGPPPTPPSGSAR